MSTRIQPGDGDPRHGTVGGYVNHGCTCLDCKGSRSRANFPAAVASADQDALRRRLRNRASETNGLGCWLWPTSDDQGYARTSVKSIQGLAHRASYMAFVGPIPDGMVVDHICFQRHCINPAHLQLLTHPENSSRQQKALSPLCSKGHPLEMERSGRQRRCMTCWKDYDRSRRRRNAVSA